MARIGRRNVRTSDRCQIPGLILFGCPDGLFGLHISSEQKMLFIVLKIWAGGTGSSLSMVSSQFLLHQKPGISLFLRLVRSLVWVGTMEARIPGSFCRS